MMRKLPGKESCMERFGEFTPIEVLYQFDFPRVFTLVDSKGSLNLAYWSDEDENRSRYVVVPTTNKTVERLKKGELTVYEALDQSTCWSCDLNLSGELVACHRVDFDSIPRDALPEKGAMLLPSHDRGKVGSFDRRARTRTSVDMTNGFIEGGGWPDRDQNEPPLENRFEVSLTSVFLFGLIPSTVALVVIVVDISLWISASSAADLFGGWGWRGGVCIRVEMGLLVALWTRCEDKGIHLRELIKVSLDYSSVSISASKTCSWKEIIPSIKDIVHFFEEMIDDMRRLYGTKS